MSFQSYLDNLRAKPEHIRKRYSFSVAFGITAIIFTFWLNSFSFINNSSNSVLASKVGKISTPGQSLIAGVGSIFVDLRDIVFGPKKVTYSSVLVTPGKK